jgi:ribose 5-phosphate isomerase
MRWRTRDGQFVVEVIKLTGTSRSRDGEWLRVKQHGIHVADVRSVEELAVYFDLADLEEALSAAA